MSKAEDLRGVLPEKWWSLAAAALDEARAEGNEDQREAWVSVRNKERAAARREGRDKGRREALEEAAVAMRGFLEHYGLEDLPGVETIRALMDQPPPDTGFRDRRPTLEEVEAHDGWWMLQHADSGTHVVYALSSYRVEGERCRPVTRDLWPAPWPKVS